VPFHVDADRAPRIAACVLENWLEDSLSEISFDADTQQPGGPLDRKRKGALGREAGAGRCRILCDSERVCCSTPGARLKARSSDERVDRTRQLLGVPFDELERGSVLAGIALPAERKLGLGQHAGERGTKLMRELGREALLPA